jgi:ribonucleotide reductase beta subunit family protein with ferritin-like domain
MSPAKNKPHILQVPESLVVEHYKEPVEFANKALEIVWFPDEIKVEKDVQDFLINMTPAERHGVKTVLKLFTLYELFAGAEYWNGSYVKIFKRMEFQRMASVFSMFELAIHAPFYRKLNEALHLDNDEFYLEYVKSPVLQARMDFINEVVTSKNDLYSLAAFSMVEGVILYSNFAFLKHFQSQGKNKLLNVVRGINFTVKDEQLHSTAGAWSFCALKGQLNLSEAEEVELKVVIDKLCEQIREHEHAISEMIFEEGNIEGITLKQMHHFVDSRINVCLEQLGYPKLYDTPYNPIAAWFYQGINNYSFNDFFSGIGSNYNRNWDESAFEYAEYSK